MAMAERKQTWLDGLNPQQIKAATYGQGPLLVVAVAGMDILMESQVNHVFYQANI